MSRSISGPRSDAPTDALRPQIYYYEDHVTIRIDRGEWDAGLERQAKSANIATDKAVRAAWKASEANGPIADPGTARAIHTVARSDPRDAIPLVYSNTTRRIMSVVGCLLSTGAIVGVNLLGNAGYVPGFKELPLVPNTVLSNFAIIMCGITAALVVISFGFLSNDISTMRNQHA